VLRARALADDGNLTAANFGFLTARRPDRAKEVAELALRLGATFPEIERALLEEAIRVCNGNEAEASRRLGISRRAVEYRLQKDSESGKTGPKETS
jgi:DNA-binding NtrC family response regulator